MFSVSKLNSTPNLSYIQVPIYFQSLWFWMLLLHFLIYSGIILNLPFPNLSRAFPSCLYYDFFLYVLWIPNIFSHVIKRTQFLPRKTTVNDNTMYQNHAFLPYLKPSLLRLVLTLILWQALCCFPGNIKMNETHFRPSRASWYKMADVNVKQVITTM